MKKGIDNPRLGRYNTPNAKNQGGACHDRNSRFDFRWAACSRFAFSKFSRELFLISKTILSFFERERAEKKGEAL
ncbi:MAG: hypothetical protein IJS31_03265 [Oscillospiraceae bacterium]|nr:hypothetical protein [Oscillospiraceae bacterium]